MPLGLDLADPAFRKRPPTRRIIAEREGEMRFIQGTLRVALAALGLVGAISLAQPQAQAQATDTIKIGVLHSLSGTMAISETTL